MRTDRTRIKVCGITSHEAAEAAVEAGADAIGLVFVKDSPRWIEPAFADEIAAQLPAFVSTVGVYRDEPLRTFLEIVEECPTRWVQLHGLEDEQLVRNCGCVIKGIRFDPDTIADELLRWSEIEEVDAILVDGSAGGEGVAFDWASLTEPMAEATKPILLAGGLTPDNVGDAIRACRPFAVDVSSGVESAPGVKDPAKVRAFCQAVRQADAGA
ncbi:MAG: phosphoribosylanthranilate isomerase [Phycisphaerales bacterium]|nr:phosphoribosylanthranilate isomerase [Phycisphaerales bacterium]